MRHGAIAAVVGLLLAATAHAEPAVLESARHIPVAYDVDVVVVGGSTRAVAAALAARENGASVFLLARRTYLGADMCAHYNLWLEAGEEATNPLAKRIFGKDELASPMWVKQALDGALLEAGVDFLYGCYPTDVLRDSRGMLAGIVMANRSGRQAVRAKAIIDATDRATVAKIAGAQFDKFPKGRQTFKRRVVGGEVSPGGAGAEFMWENLLIKSDSRRGGGRVSTNEVHEYVLDIDMKDASWVSFAGAEQEMRDRTWQDGQVDAAESIFQVPPDPIRGQAEQKAAWESASKVDLDALRPADMDALYVLSGCADVSREAAAELLRPVNGMEMGSIVGRTAAIECKDTQIGLIEDIAVSAEPGGKDAGEVGEMLNGLRSKPGMTKSAVVKSPAREVPVIGEYDVVVVGGGTAGAPAGISAARAGAKTLVLEYLDGLGGVGTFGRINRYYHGNRVGFTKEVDAGAGGSGWNIEKKQEWYRKEISKAGGDIWFHTLACGSVVKDKRFVGVVVATPHGRGIVLANTVIDATGNSVIPACAGVPCQEIGADHISVQGTGLPTFAPGAGYLNGDWSFNDDSDVLDMWRMFVVAKHKPKGDKPGYRQPFDLGQLINTRARRRIIGDIVITPVDIINERTYPDIITVSKSNFDNHGFSSHDLFMIVAPRSRIGNVPYRALMPKGYDGLLATGLGISAHGDAMPVLRMQPDVQNQGYAAGYAAAMATKGGTTVRKIDVKALQKHLVDKRIITAETMNAKDSYPIPKPELDAAVKSIGVDYTGIAKILTDPQLVMVLLRNAWKSAEADDVKLRYAHVLGMLGDGTGSETLIEELKDADWDKGWNFRGMGQYGRTTSPTDNLVIALGRTWDRKGVDVVIRLAGKLNTQSEFSHFRAVSMALESMGDPRGAEPLARLLKMAGVIGHAFTDITDEIKRTPSSFSDTSTRNKSLRELILARALYRCGDHEGLGEMILKAYAADLRGHYATHAKAVLREDR